jgi:hypothetical protein
MDDQRLIEDVSAALREPGLHHHQLVMDLLQALVKVADMRGEKDTAIRLAMKRLELARAQLG